MTESDINLPKLRRLRILQALDACNPVLLSEQEILAAVNADPDCHSDLAHIRLDIHWLAALTPPLVAWVEAPTIFPDWVAATLTDAGQAWINDPTDRGLAIYSPGAAPPRAPERGGRVSSVQTLPPEVQAWLDQELVRLRFSDYRALAAALKDQGWSLSHSAVWRYGSKLKAQIEERTARAQEKAAVAKALASVFGQDTAGLMAGALGTGLTAVIDAIEGREYNQEAQTLSGLVNAIPGLGKAFAQVEEMRIREEERAKAAAEHRADLERRAAALDQAPAARGLSAERKAALRQLITGIAA